MPLTGAAFGVLARFMNASALVSAQPRVLSESDTRADRSVCPLFREQGSTLDSGLPLFGSHSAIRQAQEDSGASRISQFVFYSLIEKQIV